MMMSWPLSASNSNSRGHIGPNLSRNFSDTKMNWPIQNSSLRARDASEKNSNNGFAGMSWGKDSFSGMSRKEPPSWLLLMSKSRYNYPSGINWSNNYKNRSRSLSSRFSISGSRSPWQTNSYSKKLSNTKNWKSLFPSAVVNWTMRTSSCTGRSLKRIRLSNN